MGGSQVSGEPASIAEALVLLGTAHVTLNAPGKPGIHLWSQRELEATLKKRAADHVREYAERTRNHLDDGMGGCVRFTTGDRCDITAALRVAADEIEKS